MNADVKVEDEYMPIIFMNSLAEEYETRCDSFIIEMTSAKYEEVTIVLIGREQKKKDATFSIEGSTSEALTMRGRLESWGKPDNRRSRMNSRGHCNYSKDECT